MLKQFMKFATVGFINTLINLTILYSLTELFGIYYLVAAVFAFLVAVTNSFIMNSLWTFKGISGKNRKEEYFKFLFINITALIVNIVILYFLTEFLGIYYLISQIISIFFSLWINFLGNKFWTFAV